MHPAEWISLGSLVVSLVAAVSAGIWAIRARASERQAAANAEAATQAALDAAGAAQRSADALEAQHKFATERANAAEAAPWRLAHSFGDTYELRNESDTPKFHVTLAGGGVGRMEMWGQIDGHSSQHFMALTGAGVGTRIVVTWRQSATDAPGSEKTWTGTKPAIPFRPNPGVR